MLNRFNLFFRRMKLTNRITVSNVILFTMLTLLIVYFVTLLTQQFLFFKNQDELNDKQLQITDAIMAQRRNLETLSKDDRILNITYLLEKLYLFEGYKFIALITDSEDRSSYGSHKSYYDSLMSDGFPVDTNEFSLRTRYNAARSSMQFEIYQTYSATELSSLYESTLRLPLSETAQEIRPIKFIGQNLLYTSSRYDFEDGSSTFITLFLNPSIDSSFILSLNSALFVSAIIGILLITVFGKFFTRRALKPLLELSYVAQNINNETLSYRIPSNNSNDEVDTLIKSLNLMLENLERTFQNQNRFVSDASHELRIPLTVVLGYTDLLKTMGTDDKPLLNEALENIESEAVNMKNLVEKLLLIARLESKRFQPNSETIPLEPFFEKLFLESQRLYTNRQFVLNLEYKGSIYADRELLQQILRALIENGVKYTKIDDYVILSSHTSERYYEIEVTDNGRGIPKKLIPDLINRFYRIDEDRNRQTGGSGLGLSIVDSLMKAHGGYMRINSEEGKYTTISLLFPKTPMQ